MALSKNQRDVLVEEINALAKTVAHNITLPVEDRKGGMGTALREIELITRVLLGEIHHNEFVEMFKDYKRRDYYRNMMLVNQPPSHYVKKGYGPDHGKGKRKAKTNE